MKGLKGVRLGFIGAAAVVLALIGGLVLSAQVSATSGGVSIGSATAAPGDEATVDLDAVDIGDPGLGAWTLDITYDSDVVSVTDCSPQQGGVCNDAFGDETIRVTGASATGLDDTTTLANITFECGDDEGTSDLDITVQVFADATIGDPLDIVPLDVSDGSITCEEPPEPTATPPVVVIVDTGTGIGSDGGSGLGWLIAALAGVGLAGIAGVGALRLRTRQS